MKEDPINKQAQTIESFHRSHKRMPSYSEMLKIFGLRSKNAVFKRVNALVKNGVLEKDEKGKLIPKNISGTVRMLGSVSAGFPSPAEEELRDLMSLDEYLISNPNATYVLKVSGDSMIDAGIHAGDLVLVQKGLEPKPDDIVVARADGEWTIKYFKKERGKTYLRAANRKYPDIAPRQELVIAGVAIANVRKYK